ncbi:hypothetical protein Mgra_00006542 [Meloidogyne graminicola]|uniref:DUF19 domain-containing protein n=1 Tax=Meloidogyne graminicola TaxID=189291 RepID=A0A8S9ZLF4_9BILA|nr:hypothetical protein Mgra_00006542 [Meloidogyne graminicola]
MKLNFIIICFLFMICVTNGKYHTKYDIKNVIKQSCQHRADLDSQFCSFLLGLVENPAIAGCKFAIITLTGTLNCEGKWDVQGQTIENNCLRDLNLCSKLVGPSNDMCTEKHKTVIENVSTSNICASLSNAIIKYGKSLCFKSKDIAVDLASEGCKEAVMLITSEPKKICITILESIRMALSTKDKYILY